MIGELAPVAIDAPLLGGIVLTAPRLCGHTAVILLVEPFLQKHPLFSARMLLVNRLGGPVGEGGDLPVRWLCLQTRRYAPSESVRAARCCALDRTMCTMHSQ